MKAGVFTIIAKNYVAHARVLMRSLRQTNPDLIPLVVLADRPEGSFDPVGEEFTVVSSEELHLPDSAWFHFKYTLLELSTAVKPYAFEHLLHRFGLDKLIYLDPDIVVYSPLERALAELETSSLVLTPHLTGPLDHAYRPTELDILRSGTYNLGFLGVAARGATGGFLKWWQEKLYDHCVVDLPRGLFVDQRWMDLAPGLFPGVAVLRDEGYNVAYWNLPHRRVAKDGERHLVNGRPLVFFHYSGFSPDNPEEFSRHQNRYRLSDLGEVADLALDYRRRLLEAGYEVCRGWRYAYGRFDNGFPIPDLARPLHHEAPAIAARIGNPFSEEGFREFLSVWNEPIRQGDPGGAGVSRLAYRVYRTRTDVQAAMPDIFGGDRLRFLQWVLSSGRTEHGLDDVFLEPAWNALHPEGGASSGPADEPPSGPDWSGPPGALLALHERLREAPREGLEEGGGPAGTLPRLTRLARSIYETRPDLQRRFPDPAGADSVKYLAWILTYGRKEYGLIGPLLSPMERQWEEALALLDGRWPRVWHRLLLAVMSASVSVRQGVDGARRSGESAWFDARMRVRRARAGANGTAAAAGVGNGSGKLNGAGRAAFGVNLVGYLRAETGVGESSRLAARAARSAGLPVCLRDFDTGAPYRRGDTSAGDVDPHFLYDFNLFHVNADQTQALFSHLEPGLTEGRHNIGYWAWELEDFPDRWRPAFRGYDEIWTPSTFCQEAIARQSSIPVLRMPHCVAVELDSNHDREYFGLPRDKFVFLAALDVLSVPERKNPKGAIDAFASAFGGNSGCHLVIKINNSSFRPAFVSSLREHARGLPVTVFDQTLARDEMNNLVNACDCFVSLHRSEGFGLLIAEAMYLGKPVIVTGYSGNLDFTKPDNSFLVGYSPRPVGKGCEPYDEHAVWAEPRLDDAAAQMRAVIEYPEHRGRVALRGRDFVRAALSPRAVGGRMLERLRLLGLRRTGDEAGAALVCAPADVEGKLICA